MAFVVGGIGILRDDSGPKLVGWGAVAFFGLGVLVAPLPLLPGAFGLRLDRDGLTIRQIWLDFRIAWADIEGFAVGGRCGGHVMIDLRTPRGSGLGRRLSGHDGMLPDTCGMKAVELASLLERWRRRWTEGPV